MSRSLNLLQHVHRLILSALALSSVGLSGCAVKERFAAPPSTFLEDVSLEHKMENLPFDHSWVVPDSDERQYDSVYVAPILIDRLPEDAWKRSAEIGVRSKKEYKREARRIADYFHERLVVELTKVKNAKLTVATEPTNSSLVVTIVLTELELSHPLTRAAALAAPLPGVDMALNTVTDPHVAFSARLTDASSEELIATVADRRYPPFRIIDLNKLFVRSSAREIVSNWSKELALAIQRNRLQTVNKTWGFSLLPW
jgi:hypothetical protein